MVGSGRASIVIAPMTQPVAYRARRITTRVDSEAPSVFGMTATVKVLTRSSILGSGISQNHASDCVWLIR
jgi:hypothetical protein